MKKVITALALVGGVAALAAYKIVKNDNKKLVETEDVEKRIIAIDQDEDEEEPNCEAAFETASYPNLEEEDMKEINEICENVFEGIDFDNVGEDERPIQHVLHFENRILLEKFKAIVIEEGFVVTNGEYENDLLVLHIAKVNVDLILSKVFYLANLAKECDGKYLNWILK